MRSQRGGGLGWQAREALRTLCWGVLAVLVSGCTHRAIEVRPLPDDPAAYAGWHCDRLHDELDAVQQKAADLAYAVDARAGNNIMALGLGLAVFWPALLAMRPEGPEAAELAVLKGRFEAMTDAAARAHCGPAPEAMAVAKVAALPVALGERLVYDERSGRAGAHALGLRVVALRRDRIEFKVDLDDHALPGTWQQDLAGNTLADTSAALLGWQRLLRPGLELGQVLAGDLSAANDRTRKARVRGQVVATGPQTVGGRQFDVAVIELFGDVMRGMVADAGGSSLDGVMAVDRRSGVLLRLELRSANAEFALRRRLLRVEAAAP